MASARDGEPVPSRASGAAGRWRTLARDGAARCFLPENRADCAKGRSTQWKRGARSWTSRPPRRWRPDNQRQLPIGSSIVAQQQRPTAQKFRLSSYALQGVREPSCVAGTSWRDATMCCFASRPRVFACRDTPRPRRTLSLLDSELYGVARRFRRSTGQGCRILPIELRNTQTSFRNARTLVRITRTLVRITRISFRNARHHGGNTKGSFRIVGNRDGAVRTGFCAVRSFSPTSRERVPPAGRRNFVMRREVRAASSPICAAWKRVHVLHRKCRALRYEVRVLRHQFR